MTYFSLAFYRLEHAIGCIFNFFSEISNWFNIVVVVLFLVACKKYE
jgi:hypothetical protein